MSDSTPSPGVLVHAGEHRNLTGKQIKFLLAEGVIWPTKDDNDETIPNEYRLDEEHITDELGEETITIDDVVKLTEYEDLLNKRGDLTDAEALDLIAYCLSAPNWTVSFLEDIDAIVGRTAHAKVNGAKWYSH